MSRISIRVIDNITMNPIVGARVFVCENTGKEVQYEKVFMNRLTDDNGIAEVETTITKDTDVFIRVRCANYDYYCISKETNEIVDKEEGLFTIIEVQEDGIPIKRSENPTKKLYDKIVNYATDGYPSIFWPWIMECITIVIVTIAGTALIVNYLKLKGIL